MFELICGHLRQILDLEPCLRRRRRDTVPVHVVCDDENDDDGDDDKCMMTTKDLTPAVLYSIGGRRYGEEGTTYNAAE